MRMQHFPLMKIRKRSISNVYGLFSLGEYPWGTQYKRPNRDVPPTWVAKLASWYINDPCIMQNLVFLEQSINNKMVSKI